MTTPLTHAERGRLGGIAGGSKGGKAKGKRKARPPEHYVQMAVKSAAVRKVPQKEQKI